MVGTGRTFEGAVKPDAITVDSYEADLFAQRITEVPSNMQKRLNYGSRTDAQPVYVGFAARGLAEGSDGWLLYYLEYDVSDRLTKVTIAYDNWTNRASATYA